MKKILITILIFNLWSLSAYAGFLSEKINPPQRNVQQKFEYINMGWWQNFTDPYLKDYVRRAIENNEDLKVATLKTDEYKQFVKQSFGRELPEMTVGSNYTGFKIPYSRDRALNISDNGYVLPFTVQYEADLLLKNHDKTKSAKKQYDAEVLQEKSTYIAVASYVATVYINILKTDKLITLQSQMAAVCKEELRREEKKHTRGVASAVDVNGYKEKYKQALNALDSSVKSRDILLNQLAVLVGDTPNNSPCYKRGSFDRFNFCGVTPECIPSDVIFSRPDVAAVEAQLQAAKIDVRVARKELFPTFSIAGNLWFNTFTTEPFWSWKGTYASLVAGGTQTLFAGGRRLANLHLKKNLYEQMFENYRQSNLKATQEVNDSLRSLKIDTNVDHQNLNRLKIEENTFIRISKKYDRGVIAYPDVLAERERLIAIQTDKTNSKASRFVNYLGLYKAAGGKL